MNRADRRRAERLCAKQGHLTKSGGDGQQLPFCVRCGRSL